MKRVLIFAAVGEAGLGLALLLLPSLAGHAAGRNVDLQRGRHAVSRLPRLRGRFDRHTPMAGGRPAPDPDGAFGLGIYKRQGDENIKE